MSLISEIISLPLVDQVKFFTNTFKTLQEGEESDLLQEAASIHASDSIDKYIEWMALKTLISHQDRLINTPLSNYNENQWHCVHQYANFLMKCHESEKSPNILGNSLKSFPDFSKECPRHCSCVTIKLITTLISEKLINEKLISDTLINYLVRIEPTKKCVSNSRLNFLIKVLDQDFGANSFIIENFLHQNLELLVPSSVTNELLFSTPMNEPLSNSTNANLTFLLIKIIAISQHSPEKKLINLNLIKKALIDDETIITKLLIEDDEKLINVCYFLIKIYAEVGNRCKEKLISVMDIFISKIIHNDASVLIDWLISDEETSIPLMKMLIMFLKVNGVKDRMTESINATFRSLLDKLTGMKTSLPFNVNPLIRLLRNVLE